MPTSASSADSTRASPSRPAGSKASPPARARASGSASSSTARGASRPSHILTTAEADRVAARGRPDRPGVGDRAARAASSSTTGRRPAAPSRRPSTRTRSRSRSSARSPTCWPRTRPPRGSRGSSSPSRCTRPSASGRRSPRRTAATPSRRSPTSASAVEANAIDGDEHQRRSYPDSGGGWNAAGYEYIRGLDLAASGRAAGRGGRRAADARRSARRAGSRSSSTRSQLYLQVHESCGHPTELDRVFGTEASYAGTSFLTTDKLDDGLPLRLRPHRHRRRRDRARRHGHVRLGRRGRRGAGRAARPGTGSSSATCRSRETAPRIGRPSGGAMRADGWNRIPLIRMTNINLLPQPGMSLDEIVADTDDGLYLASNRSLVDRRPAAQLPVRDRGRLRDQGRQEGPAVQEPDLHRDHLRVLALVRRGRRRAELRDARHAELRQGRAGPDRPRRPRRAGRPLPRRPGRRRQVVSRRMAR